MSFTKREKKVCLRYLFSEPVRNEKKKSTYTGFKIVYHELFALFATIFCSLVQITLLEVAFSVRLLLCGKH